MNSVTSLLHNLLNGYEGLLDIILWYLHEPALRDASENLCKLGVLTKEKYNKHWHKRCEELSHKMPFPNTADYGWFVAIIETSQQTDKMVDVSHMSILDVIHWQKQYNEGISDACVREKK